MFLLLLRKNLTQQHKSPVAPGAQRWVGREENAQREARALWALAASPGEGSDKEPVF